MTVRDSNEISMSLPVIISPTVLDCPDEEKLVWI